MWACPPLLGCFSHVSFSQSCHLALHRPTWLPPSLTCLTALLCSSGFSRKLGHSEEFALRWRSTPGSPLTCTRVTKGQNSSTKVTGVHSSEWLRLKSSEARRFASSEQPCSEDGTAGRSQEASSPRMTHRTQVIPREEAAWRRAVTVSACVHTSQRRVSSLGRSGALD